MAVPVRQAQRLPRGPGREGSSPSRRGRPAASRRPVSRASTRAPRQRVHRSSAAPAPRRRRLPFLLLFLALTGILVTTLVAAQALVAQGSFRIQELQRRVESLHSGYGHLRLRYAELASPGRIEAEAKAAGLIAHQRLEVLPVPGGSATGGAPRPRGT